MKLSCRNILGTVILLLAGRCAVYAYGQGSAAFDTELQKFKELPGPEQVRRVVDYPLHHRRFLFWRQQGDAWLTAADARHAFEEDIVIHSPDADINKALASEVESTDFERVRYALYLLCLRARFVPRSEFPINQVSGSSLSPASRRGSLSDFRPNFDKLGEEAGHALRVAMTSPNLEVRRVAKLYSFALLDDLSSESTTEIAAKWRAEILKEDCYPQANSSDRERRQLTLLLKRSLAGRGLDAVVAVSSLLKTESDARARYHEVYMLQFLDAASVRLRGSAEGREAIQVAKDAWGKELRVCWKVYKDSTVRESSWRGLEDQFFRDKLGCALGDWASLIAVAMDEKYNDHLSVPFEREKGYRACGPKMEEFLSRLTDLDPSFPAWEFPSTASTGDMFHPQFWAKIQRYHEAFVRMSKSQESRPLGSSNSENVAH